MVLRPGSTSHKGERSRGRTTTNPSTYIFPIMEPSADLLEQMKAQGINPNLEFNPIEDDDGHSVVSFSDESYIKDLYGQRERREQERKEYLMEEAKILYKQALDKGSKKDEKMYLDIYDALKAEHAQTFEEEDELLDARLLKALEEKVAHDKEEEEAKQQAIEKAKEQAAEYKRNAELSRKRAEQRRSQRNSSGAQSLRSQSRRNSEPDEFHDEIPPAPIPRRSTQRRSEGGGRGRGGRGRGGRGRGRGRGRESGQSHRQLSQNVMRSGSDGSSANDSDDSSEPQWKIAGEGLEEENRRRRKQYIIFGTVAILIIIIMIVVIVLVMGGATESDDKGDDCALDFLSCSENPTDTPTTASPTPVPTTAPPTTPPPTQPPVTTEGIVTFYDILVPNGIIDDIPTSSYDSDLISSMDLLSQRLWMPEQEDPENETASRRLETLVVQLPTSITRIVEVCKFSHLCVMSLLPFQQWKLIRVPISFSCH